MRPSLSRQFITIGAVRSQAQSKYCHKDPTSRMPDHHCLYHYAFSKTISQLRDVPRPALCSTLQNHPSACFCVVVKSLHSPLPTKHHQSAGYSFPMIYNISRTILQSTPELYRLTSNRLLQHHALNSMIRRRIHVDGATATLTPP